MQTQPVVDRGHLPAENSQDSVCENLNLTQQQFAALMGASVCYSGAASHCASAWIGPFNVFRNAMIWVICFSLNFNGSNSL